MARRNLVRGVRESQYRLRDPAREIHPERAGDEDAGEKRGQQTPEDRQPALVEAGLRPGEDDGAEDLVAKLDGPRKSEQPDLPTGTCELEPDRLPGEDPLEVQHPARQKRVGRRGAGEEIDPLRGQDIEDLVTRRTLEIERRRGGALADACGVDLVDPGRLARKLAECLLPQRALRVPLRDADGDGSR